LEDERSKVALLQAWAGDSLTPPNDQGWIPWIETAIKRVMSCSNRLTKEKKRAKGATIRTHTGKIKLAKA
jgi:hypothetical protein